MSRRHTVPALIAAILVALIVSTPFSTLFGQGVTGGLLAPAVAQTPSSQTPAADAPATPAPAIPAPSAASGELSESSRRGIVFSVLSAEGQTASGPLWEPLLADMERALGVPVSTRFGTNYNTLIEAMRFNQTQVGWFSALPALQAVDRAEGEVIARTVDLEGRDSYVSTLIVRRGSGITLDDVLRCDRSLTFGLGDAQSTSGTLAPMTFLFSPRNINPTQCFSTVRSANHQANSLAVATGVVNVATSNSVNTVFLERRNPEIAAQIESIWESPPIPESGIVLRADLDPVLKERIRAFFLTYGKGDGPEAARQREILANLNYSEFREADDSYLDPIRAMREDQQRREMAEGETREPFQPTTGFWVLVAVVAGALLIAIGGSVRKRLFPPRAPAAPVARDPAEIPPPPVKSLASWMMDIVLWGGLAIVLALSFQRVELQNITRLFSETENVRIYGRDFLNPDFSNWQILVQQMWLTVQIALWGTFLAVFIGVPLGLLAARNIAPDWIVWPVRRIMDVLRSVPDLVMGTLFIVAVGLGPLAGVLAIAFNTAGVLAKLFSEAVESIDHGPVEGVRATGGQRLHEIVWGVIPQVAPLWTSFALYRFESNSRAATVLGLIGAGGIGQLLFESIQAFDYRLVSAIAIVIVVAVTLIDMLSQMMRKRLL